IVHAYSILLTILRLATIVERTVSFSSRPGWEDRDMSWTVDPMHTQVEFSAKHMGLMTVKGHFTNVRAAIDLNEDDFTASSVEATIDTHSLITNDARRDAHLKSPDLLDVEKLTNISLK